MKKGMVNMKKITEKFQKLPYAGLIAHSIIMLILVLIVYWQYLVGNRTYIFTDIGSDSFGQTYPNLVYLARKIELGHFMNRWNFVSSIGNEESMIIPKLANLEAFFGAENIPYLLGFNQALKVFFSGIFFYGYLRKLKSTRFTSSVFAIYYAFCAPMMIRGAWRSYPNEVLTLAIWLFAFEAWFSNRKKWFGLVIASAFFYLNCSGYFIVLYTGIFVVYAIFRCIIDDGSQQYKGLIKGTIFFVGALICALLLSAVSWGDSIVKQVGSDRMSNGVDRMKNYGNSALFTGFDTLKTAFFRTIGTDILGINDYCGTENFLEAPAFYCGLLTLLLILPVYLSTRGKQKAGFSIGLAGIVLYIFIRPVRFLANGLSGHTFKLASLWVIVLLLFIAASGFDMFLKELREHGLKSMIVTAVLIIVLSVVCAVDGMSWIKLFVSIAFCICYVMALWLYRGKHMELLQLKTAILILVSVEVLTMSYGCVNNRGTMDEGDVYLDGTAEALAWIEQGEGESGFYRIDKRFEAASYCDSLYQNFMGTVSYIGGSGDRKSTGDFCQILAMPVLGGNNHSVTGFSTSTTVNTLMNVKYVLSKSGIQTNYGYDAVEKVGDVYVYENRYALPLGYVYDNYISMEEFLNLSIMERREIMLSACVLEEDNPLLSKKTDLKSRNIDYTEYMVSVEKEETDNWLRMELPEAKEGFVTVVVLDVESDGSQSSMMELYKKDGTSETRYIGVADGRDVYHLEFNDPEIQMVHIFGTDQYEIEDVLVCQIPQSIYYEDYVKQCETLQENGIHVDKIDCNMILGTIESDKDGMMTLSIPYDDNWQIYIDGAEQKLEPVNIAMMGTVISKGTHKIELVYEKENDSAILVAIGIGVFILFLFAHRGFERNGKR